MKRIILMLGLMMVISLVSCTPVQPTQDSNELDFDEPATVTPPEVKESMEEPEVEEQETVEEEEVTPTVSKEELDQLKADLEEMEFEDLGGLSE